MLRYEWIWYKERGTGFLNANRAPLKKSENILVFYQKSPAYFPQFTYGEPYSKVHARKGSSPNYGKFERQGSASNDGRRYPGNVLFVQTVAHPTHPTQKARGAVRVPYQDLHPPRRGGGRSLRWLRDNRRGCPQYGPPLRLL